MTKLIVDELKVLGTEEKARHLMRFFKCGKGQYGEGDIFLGVKNPEVRSVVKRWWQQLSLSEIDELIKSPYHEVRLTALLCLKEKYRLCCKRYVDDAEKCIDFYLSHTVHINNWDLVDLSCTDILGHWLWKRDRTILYTLAQSSDMWEQRIAIVTTLFFNRKGDVADSLALSEILLSHSHDLIHKAVGWALREVGKADFDTLRIFVDTHWRQMSRTTLRYSIEHYPETERQAILARR